MPDCRIEFSIDGSDRLLAVNDDWNAFAAANAGESLHGDNILGQSLWTQISDEATRAIYRLIIERVRAGRRFTFRYRCDSPRHRRVFDMEVTGGFAGRVTFVSNMAAEEERPTVALLDSGQKRDQRQVRICSWCQSLNLPDGSWVPVEEAVARIDYLAQPPFPIVTHGICTPCSTRLLASVTEN